MQIDIYYFPTHRDNQLENTVQNLFQTICFIIQVSHVYLIPTLRNWTAIS